jgi:hypothetical protein
MFWDAVNGSLGIATTSLTGFSLRVSKNITGAIETIGIQQSGAVSNDVTTVAVGFDNALVLNAGAVTNSYNHFRARRQVYAATSFGTQIGFLANNTLTDATNNYGFYGDIPSGTGRWNLYMVGTAANYINGTLLIGSTTDIGGGQKLQVTGASYFSGNLGIGTAASYRLDVLGSTLTEPSASPVDDYATRIRRTYVNNNASVGGRRYNIWSEVRYDGNQAYTNTASIYAYVFYNNTNASSIAYGGAVLIETSASSVASSLIGNQSAITLGGTVTNAIFYRSYTVASVVGTATNVTHFKAEVAGATTTITNQYGFFVDASLNGGTNDYGFYGNLTAATGVWNLYMNGTAANYMNAELLLGSTTNSGERLQVTGTMKVTGASNFGGNMNVSLNQNSNTTITVTNTTVGTFSVAEFVLQSNTVASFGKTNSGYATFKTIVASDFYMYNAGAGDITILNNFATGNIKLTAGGSSTPHMTIKSNGRINMSSLPTSPTGLSSGDLWNNLGMINIV